MPPWSLLPGSHTSRQLGLEPSVNADKITAYIRTQATGWLLGHTETILSRKKEDVCCNVPSLCPRSGAVLYTLQWPGHTSPHKAGEAQPRTKMEINYLVSACAGLACAVLCWLGRNQQNARVERDWSSHFILFTSYKSIPGNTPQLRSEGNTSTASVGNHV